ncbi:MAG: sulfatase-like hydrolase/transferase [Polyangiaceae bacterium]|nr:sulfatase-like hydrolase/transferase [Polyangiaceae bacterium]
MPREASSAARARSPNLVLWATFSLTSLAVGGYFLAQAHTRLGVDAALGAASLVARTASFVLFGLLAEGVLLRGRGGYLTQTPARRVVVHASSAALLLASVALVVDASVFAFASYHLTTALRILFSDGPAGAARVVEAAGLPLSTVLGAGVGLVIALLAAGGVSRITRGWSARRPVPVPRRTALVGLGFAFSAVALLDAAGARVRDPYIWEREVESVPLAFSLARPPAELASFAVKVDRPDASRQRRAAEALARRGALPDVYLVIVESLRSDIVTPEIMPNFAAFSRDAWTFSHAQTTGNVTHYSWYGLLCGDYPVHFDGAKRAPGGGSVALSALRALGYRTRLFATPDTAYQRLDSVVFGAGGALLDDKYHPSAPLAAERDRAVVREVARVIAEEPAGGKLNLIALDSTHFDYAWGEGFRPPFTPYAATASIGRSYARDARARAALFNRYKSSAAWMDQLLGQLFDALRAAGKLDGAIVIVTGDHGEAFWEHGSGSHGSDLGREQLEIGFAMRLPGHAARRDDAVFSLLDVMPTILTHVGVDAAPLLPGVAAQRRVREGGMAPRAALTFQGWSTRAFRFAMTRGDRRLLFELDAPDPGVARRLTLKDVTDLDSNSLVIGAGAAPAEYQRVVRELPRVLDELPFLQL